MERKMTENRWRRCPGPIFKYQWPNARPGRQNVFAPYIEFRGQISGDLEYERVSLVNMRYICCNGIRRAKQNLLCYPLDLIFTRPGKALHFAAVASEVGTSQRLHQ